MGRVTNISTGHSHFCRQITNQDWQLSWCYDYYPKGVRWRGTRIVSRNTDEIGAKKFCKKWNIIPKLINNG